MANRQRLATHYTPELSDKVVLGGSLSRPKGQVFLLAYFESARLNYEVVLWIMGIRPVLELKPLRTGGKIIVWEVLQEAGLA